MEVLQIQGKNAPTDVQPFMLERTDCSRTNYSQVKPTVSRELVNNEALYHVLTAQFSDLFDWISNSVSHLSP